MECCLSVVFLMGGFALIITALVMNGIPLGPRILPRTAAIVLGLILLMPMCCGFGGMTGYGAYRGADIAMQQAKANQGRPMTPAEQQAMQQQIQRQLEEMRTPLLIYFFTVWGLTVVLALIVGLTSTEPRPPAAAAPPPPPSDYGFRAPPPPDGGYKPRDF